MYIIQCILYNVCYTFTKYTISKYHKHYTVWQDTHHCQTNIQRRYFGTMLKHAVSEYTIPIHHAPTTMHQPHVSSSIPGPGRSHGPCTPLVGLLPWTAHNVQLNTLDRLCMADWFNTLPPPLLAFEVFPPRTSFIYHKWHNPFNTSIFSNHNQRQKHPDPESGFPMVILILILILMVMTETSIMQ